MEIVRLAVSAVLARRINKGVSPRDVEIESFWFEPDGYWRCVLVHNGGIVRVCGSIGELFNGPTVSDTVAAEEPSDAVVEPGSDGRIELQITGKGYGVGEHYATFCVQTRAGDLNISEICLHHTLGPAFREIFGDADTMEIAFSNKHGVWATKKA